MPARCTERTTRSGAAGSSTAERRERRRISRGIRCSTRAVAPSHFRACSGGRIDGSEERSQHGSMLRLCRTLAVGVVVALVLVASACASRCSEPLHGARASRDGVATLQLWARGAPTPGRGSSRSWDFEPVLTLSALSCVLLPCRDDPDAGNLGRSSTSALVLTAAGRSSPWTPTARSWSDARSLSRPLPSSTPGSRALPSSPQPDGISKDCSGWPGRWTELAILQLRP